MKSKMINKQTLLLGGLLFILVFSSLMYIPVVASDDDDENGVPTDDEDDDGIPDDEEDEDDDGVHDHDEEDNKRKLQIEVSDYEAHIESSLQTGDVHNEFGVEMHAEDEGLKFQFEFERDNDTVETELEFQVVLSEIIEYIDDPMDGYYNESIDEVVQVVELNDWNPIVYTIETIGNDTVHVFSIETDDSVFSATIYITGEFTVVNEVLVAPTQLKIDVGIHNFNYTEPDSVLALKVKLDSEEEVDYEDDEETEDEEYENATNEHEVEVTLGDYSGFFSWIETATIDGVEQEVKATPIDVGAEENKLYLNYPRGNEIIHDPKIGIAGVLQITSPTGFLGIRSRIELPDLSRNELLIVSAAALLTITGLVMVFRRKRRR
ncbi:MAG: hypothetical protein HGN29_15650 [Asgard group archaeon]|nr:hypothetical protein [Asgard group archaeon]